MRRLRLGDATSYSPCRELCIMCNTTSILSIPIQMSCIIPAWLAWYLDEDHTPSARILLTYLVTGITPLAFSKYTDRPKLSPTSPCRDKGYNQAYGLYKL